MKLKRTHPGVYRIGLTDWYVMRVFDEQGRPLKAWDLGHDSPKGLHVGEMFSSKKEALEYFRRHGFGRPIILDARPFLRL